MEKTLKFNSQIATSRSQSERLLSLGLKKETADCCWTTDERDNIIISLIDEAVEYIEPAWSLHRLIEMVDNECVIHLNNFTISGWLFEVCDNLFDNIIDCIEWIIKRGYFNKEYLEE